MEARRRIRQWRAGRCLGRRLRRLVDLLFLGAFLFFWGLGGWAGGCLGWEIAAPKVSTSLAVSA